MHGAHVIHRPRTPSSVWGTRHQSRGEPSSPGQALPLVIGVVAVLAVLVAGLGWFAGSLVDAAQARTAADAAALAGAVGGRAEAARLAAHNRAELVEYTEIGNDVVVTVRCGRATASARATASRAEFSTLGVRGRARSPE